MNNGFICMICGQTHTEDERAFGNAASYGAKCWSEYQRVKRQEEKRTGLKFGVPDYRQWRKMRNLDVPSRPVKRGRHAGIPNKVHYCRSCGEEVYKLKEKKTVCVDCYILWQRYAYLDRRLSLEDFLSWQEAGRNSEFVVFQDSTPLIFPGPVKLHLAERERVMEEILAHKMEGMFDEVKDLLREADAAQDSTELDGGTD
jgi:hypothetical protein